MSKTVIQAHIRGKDGNHPLFISPSKGTREERLEASAIRSNAVRRECKTVTDLNTAKWIPRGESVKVAGREIGGMVYVTDAEPVKLGEGYELGEFINTNLPVAKPNKHYDLSKDRYYEHYHYFSPNLRAAYLDWLASGRDSKTYKLQCVMIYYAGLQRRFLYDDSDLDEKKEILKEIERLYEVYSHDFDLERDLRIFRDIAYTLIYPNQLSPTIDEKNTWFPVSLIVGLGCRVAKREKITADWALSWYLCSYVEKMSVIYDFWEEFVETFREEFQKTYPEGLAVRRQKEDLVIHYESALEDEFYIDFLFKTTDGRTVLDVISLDLPFSRIWDVAFTAEKRVFKYYDFTLFHPEQKESKKAISMLPKCLWDKRLGENFQKIKNWASDAVDNLNGGVDIREYIKSTGGECSDRVTKAEFEKAADIAAFLGFGVAEDRRYSIDQEPFKEKVTLFRTEPTKKLIKEPRKVYSNTNLAITTGFWVALKNNDTDRELDSVEQDVLKDFIESTKQLNSSEKDRLYANLLSYVESPPTLKLLTKPLMDANSRVKRTVQKLVVEMARANLAKSSEQIKKVKEVYRILELDPEQVTQELRE